MKPWGFTIRIVPTAPRTRQVSGEASPAATSAPDRSARKTYPAAFAKRSTTRNPTLCRVSSYRAPGFPRPTTTLKGPSLLSFLLGGAAPRLRSGAPPP